METARSKLTVLFDPPFWTGIFEREGGGRYEACRVVFGAEPRDFEVYEFLLTHYSRLEFSPSIAISPEAERTVNPKRAHRLAHRQTQPASLGTKAQQALQRQREEQKAQRRVRTRAEREAEEERRFQLRQAKRKAKHKGR